VNGTGRWGHLSTQIERVALFSRAGGESEQEWSSFCGERASGVERIRHRHTDEITTCVSDVRKKATLGANQRRRILQACASSTNLSVTDFIARYQYGSEQ
jgi:hypothetical protein